MPFSEQKSTLRAVLLAHRSVRVIIGGNSRRNWPSRQAGIGCAGTEARSCLEAMRGTAPSQRILATKRRIRPAPDLSGFEANGSKGKARLPPLILSTKDGKDHRA